MNVAAAVSGLLSLTVQITEVTQSYIASILTLSHAVSYYLDELVNLKKLLSDIQDALLLHSASNFALEKVKLNQNLLLATLGECTGDLEQLHVILEDGRGSTIVSVLKRLTWPLRDSETTRWVGILSKCRHKIQSSVMFSGL